MENQKRIAKIALKAISVLSLELSMLLPSRVIKAITVHLAKVLASHQSINALKVGSIVRFLFILVNISVKKLPFSISHLVQSPFVCVASLTYYTPLL